MSDLQDRLAGALLEQEKRSRWATLGDERRDLLMHDCRLTHRIRDPVSFRIGRRDEAS